MSKGKNRFSWAENHDDMSVTVLDTATDDELTFDPSELTSEINTNVILYGIKQKVSDSQSQAAADDKMAGYESCWARLVDGKWNADKVVGARQLPPIIEVIQAEHNLSVSAAQKSWAACSDELKAAILLKQAEKVERIKKAREADKTKSLDDMA